MARWVKTYAKTIDQFDALAPVDLLVVALMIRLERSAVKRHLLKV